MVHVERRERNGGEEEEVRETSCVWIDTKQLSAVVDPIQLNLRMWTGGGSGGGGGLTWLVGRVESFSCYTTARVFSRPASGPAALCLFFFY